MQCGECKFWGTDEHSYKIEDVRKCSRPEMLFDSCYWEKEDDESMEYDSERKIKPEFENLMMFTQDASDYRADLYTREGFFCAEFSPK